MVSRDKPQVDKFIDVAKKLGCNESEAAFNEKLKKLVKPEKARKENKNE